MTDDATPVGALRADERTTDDDDEAARAGGGWFAVLLGLVVLVAFIVAALLLAGLDDDDDATTVSAGAAATTSTTASVDLEAEVSDRLMRVSLTGIGVSLNGSDEIVLTGEVATDEIKDRAGRVAGAVAGVGSVDNQLKVLEGETPDEPAEPPTTTTTAAPTTTTTVAAAEEASKEAVAEETATDLNELFADKQGVLFATGSAVLSDQATQILDEAVDILTSATEGDIEIGGHTDSVGPTDGNQRLSERRAVAVRDYLVDNGVDEARLTVFGYGETEPTASNDTEEGRAENRRIEFTALASEG